MAFIGHYTHLYEIVRHPHSYLQLYMMCTSTSFWVLLAPKRQYTALFQIWFYAAIFYGVLIRISPATFLQFDQDTVVLWSKSSLFDEIDQKFEGSRPAANSFFCKWMTIDARNKEKIWRRNKRKTKNKRAREQTTIDARASAPGIKKWKKSWS